MLGLFAISESAIAGFVESNVAPLDLVAPTFTGVLEFIKNSGSITVDWSGAVASDNVAIARREYRIGGTGAYTAASVSEELSATHTFAGLLASTTYQIDVRAVDTSGNVSSALTGLVATISPESEGGLNYIRYSLVTHDREQHVDLVNLRYALFSQLSPSSFTAPVAKGTIPSLSGPAELNIPISAAVAPAGWYMLILSDADNTTTVAVPVLVN